MRKVVYFVTDQYKPKSIKSLEREEREASDGTMQVRIEKREEKRLRQWKKYLRNDQNKLELVKFLLEDWSDPTRYAHLFPPANILFLNCGSQFFRLSLMNDLIDCILNWFVIKRRLIQNCSCVPSTQKHLGSRLLVFQQWIRILQYTRCIFLCKY